MITPAKPMTERDWYLTRLKGAGTTCAAVPHLWERFMSGHASAAEVIAAQPKWGRQAVQVTVPMRETTAEWRANTFNRNYRALLDGLPD